MSKDRIMTFYIVTLAECEVRDRGYRKRPLSARGKISVELVARRLRDIYFDAVYVSPAWRAHDAVSAVAKPRGIGIEIIHELCIQARAGKYMDYCDDLCTMSLNEIMLRLSDGDKLCEAQKRCVGVLRAISRKLVKKTVLIGTHATVLALLLSELEPDFNFGEFVSAKQEEPYLYKLEFCGDEYLGSWPLLFETENINDNSRS